MKHILKQTPLPETCWIDNFFVPEITAQKIFLDKYKGNKSAEEFVKYEKHGAELYNKYKEYYGYVFYIGKKIQEPCQHPC